jgi:hypothetical protein
LNFEKVCSQPSKSHEVKRERERERETKGKRDGGGWVSQGSLRK